MVCKHETQIIQNCRIVLLELERFAERLFRIVDFVHLFVQRALHEVHLFFIGETLEGLVQGVLSLVELPGALIDAGYGREHIEIFFCALHQFLQRFDTFIHPAFLGDQVRTHYLKLAIVGRLGQSLFAALKRFIEQLSLLVRLDDH